MADRIAGVKFGLEIRAQYKVGEDMGWRHPKEMLATQVFPAPAQAV